jgi:arylsulfatase A-like enzyme
MPLEEVTLAEAFKEAGYATGFVGKWHLGDRPYYPEEQGFDVNVAGSQYGYPFTYFSPYKRGDNSMELEGGEEGEYLTDRLTDESLKFLESNKDKPFLLYHSYYTVHNPQEAKPELVDKYRIKSQGLPPHSGPRYIRDGDRETRQAQDDPVYAGMVQSLDESVGRILRKLEEMGVADHTAVIFMSDNGGLSTSEGSPTSNVPLRGGKGWLYEGGVREPMIVHWPGTVKGGSVCSEPVISNDFYPTMLEMAGISARPAQHVDGVSLVPLLQQEDDLPERPLFWHFPHYGNQGGLPGAAVRLGDFKLIEFFEDGSLELYNLREDLSEENNLVQAMPDKVEELLELLHDWQESVDARMPSPNPDFDPDAWEAFHRRQRENSRR